MKVPDIFPVLVTGVNVVYPFYMQLYVDYEIKYNTGDVATDAKFGRKGNFRKIIII